MDCSDLISFNSPFSKLNYSMRESLGNESLGILNVQDTGRPSLGILQLTATVDRESLGFSSSNTRESLGILNISNYGRESLGILNLESPEHNLFDFKKPEIMLSEYNARITTSPIKEENINTDLLFPVHRKPSAISSTSSTNQMFNSQSLEGPSQIYSVSSFGSNFEFCSSGLSDLNNAFGNTTDFLDKLKDLDGCNISAVRNHLLNKAIIMSPNRSTSFREALLSLPDCIAEQNKEALKPDPHMFLSCDRSKKKLKPRNSFHGLNFDEEENEFNDSVFIEAAHFTSRLADGSILDKSFEEDCILDCTPQPHFPLSDDEEIENAPPKRDTESIFKEVDKMLPPSLHTSSKPKKTKSDSSDDASDNNSNKMDCNNLSKGSRSSEVNDSKVIQNLSDILHDKKLSISRRSNTSRSKDAKEILQNLSEILINDSRTEHQKSEGKNLLFSLVDILSFNNTRSNSFDDSGHSSAQDSPNKGECNKSYEVLDLRCPKNVSMEPLKTNTISEDIPKALDLSINSKTSDSIHRRLRHSISMPDSKNNTTNSSLDLSKSRNLAKSVSVLSNDGKNMSNNNNLSTQKPLIAGKLKSKIDSKVVKKGPLKAFVPVSDMAKKSNGLEKVVKTPKKSQTGPASTLHSKRTSTPINSPRLRPMAQSTPENQKSKNISHFAKKSETTNSPLVRPSKKVDRSQQSRLNTSNSAPNLSENQNELKVDSLNLSPGARRRFSTNEAKKGLGEMRVRSFSAGNQAGLMSALSRARENMKKSSYHLASKNLNNNNSESKPTALRENRKFTLTKPSSLKIIKPGKENIAGNN